MINHLIKELTLTEERKSLTIYSLNSNYISCNTPKFTMQSLVGFDLQFSPAFNETTPPYLLFTYNRSTTGFQTEKL